MILHNRMKSIQIDGKGRLFEFVSSLVLKIAIKSWCATFNHSEYSVHRKILEKVTWF